MGLDLTLFMADWNRLRAVPVENRVAALEDAARPAGPEEDLTDQCAGGWRWPRHQESPWCAEYVFFTTTGSYRPHARAGDAWADIRPLVDVSVREAMDGFLGGLIWDSDPADDPALTGGGLLPPAVGDRRRPEVLLVCPPETVSRQARAWGNAASRVEELREPFAAECAGWAGRPDSFEEFIALLREWGEVSTEAARRGWGLVGLP